MVAFDSEFPLKLLLVLLILIVFLLVDNWLQTFTLLTGHHLNQLTLIVNATICTALGWHKGTPPDHQILTVGGHIAGAGPRPRLRLAY